jgi:hypothetical protein
LRLACDPRELVWTPHDRFRTLAALPVVFQAGQLPLSSAEV